MNKAFLLMIVFLGGCTAPPKMPVDVSLIPNDCANRHAIIGWLESNVNYYQSNIEYEQNITNIKARIWHIRYHCQPVKPGPGHALR